MPDERNVDRGPPLTEADDLVGAPVLADAFPAESRPAFWMPGQYTGQNGAYQAGDPALLAGAPLKIPRVVRFTFGSRDTYDPADYDDGAPPPDPTAHHWVVVGVTSAPLPGPPNQPTTYSVNVNWADEDDGLPTTYTMNYQTFSEGLNYFQAGMNCDLPTDPYYVLGSEVNYDPNAGEYYFYNNGVYTVVAMNGP